MATSTPPESKEDVCNLAAVYCGERAVVTNIESPVAPLDVMFSKVYDHVRRVHLREFVWNFAQKYDTLTRVASTDDRYDDAYNKPIDLLRISGLGENYEDPITDYDISDTQILANNDGGTLPIRYTKDVTNVTYMDDLFVSTLALRLARTVAFTITKKRSVAADLDKMYAVEIMRAIAVDGQERPPRRIQKSKYLTARRRGGISNDDRYYNVE